MQVRETELADSKTLAFLYKSLTQSSHHIATTAAAPTTPAAAADVDAAVDVPLRPPAASLTKNGEASRAEHSVHWEESVSASRSSLVVPDRVPS